MSSRKGSQLKILAFVTGSLIAALLVVYAMRTNLWYEREPFVLDIPKTTIMEKNQVQEKQELAGPEAPQPEPFPTEISHP